jgi:alkylation response protein AidB-like acyl-CoA dehydrogenase
LALRESSPEERALAVSSCKVCVGRALRAVGQGAVQLHGAMGVTEELYVARCFRRATHIELLFGQASQHLRRMDPLLFDA